MALTESIESCNAQSPRKAPVQPSNIIPFLSTRGRLQVTLPHAPHDRDRASMQLRALLQSPLGVYVLSTEIARDEVRVQLDIAYDDLDFTLHTLICTVPAALVGPLKRRSCVAKRR